MGEPAWGAAGLIPTEGRSSVSTEQRENLEAILRQSAFPAGSDVNEQRRQLRELISAQPLPADVSVTAAALGGVPPAEITVDGIEPRHVVLYFHGGVYVMGDAFLAADLASQAGRRTHAKVIAVDYRLAPEHPYPAAVDDALAAYEALLQNGTAPSDTAFAGESAGGGLAVATMVNARDHGLPLPAAAFVVSPYADLTLAGTTMDTKREVDPLLSREALQPRVTDYTSGQDAALGLISPVFADLRRPHPGPSHHRDACRAGLGGGGRGAIGRDARGRHGSRCARAAQRHHRPGRRARDRRGGRAGPWRRGPRRQRRRGLRRDAD